MSGGSVQITDLGAFYNLYFKNDKKIVMMYPNDHEEKPWGMVEAFLCPSCMQLEVAEGKKHSCSSCGTEQIPVIFPVKQEDAGKNALEDFAVRIAGASPGFPSSV